MQYGAKACLVGYLIVMNLKLVDVNVLLIKLGTYAASDIPYRVYM